MKTIVFDKPHTKACPFCAEIIQVRALKCRFCGEFLNTDKSKELAKRPNQTDESESGQKPDKVLFAARPSLWGICGTLIRTLVLLALGIFIISFQLEDLAIFKSRSGLPAGRVNPNVVKTSPPLKNTSALTEEQAQTLAKCRVVAGVGLIGLALFVLLVKVIRLKMTYYEITADRIEHSRGVLDRKVDNLDIFRIVDLKLRRSLFDCIVGVGTVSLVTNDKTDPKFTFAKVRNSRGLYDVIKKASLESDRRNGVVHLE